MEDRYGLISGHMVFRIGILKSFRPILEAHILGLFFFIISRREWVEKSRLYVFSVLIWELDSTPGVGHLHTEISLWERRKMAVPQLHFEILHLKKH